LMSTSQTTVVWQACAMMRARTLSASARASASRSSLLGGGCAARADRERPGSVASALCSSAAAFGCGIGQRPRRASTIPRAWSKSVSEARQHSRWSDDDWGRSSAVTVQSVQLAGMSERLPSGSTTSNNSVPRRLMVPITGNERPSDGCRSRRIVTDLEMSRRQVVCDDFLRHHPARATAQIGGPPHRRPARAMPPRKRGCG
jgi:hypothetical protein